MLPIIIYGGSFDPVHRGHISVAVKVSEHLNADVHLLPCKDPVHKAKTLASAAHRVAMLKLAIAQYPNLHLDLSEIERATPSYTLDTLKFLRAKYGAQCPIIFMLGLDSFASIHEWHDYQEILSYAHLLVVDRPILSLASKAGEGSWLLQHKVDSQDSLLQNPHGKIYCFAAGLYPISSSAVRECLAAGLDAADFLIPEVCQYINKNALYKTYC
jgi:nicotinate-nucleotide adenylyltransferase